MATSSIFANIELKDLERVRAFVGRVEEFCTSNTPPPQSLTEVI